jgi:5-formyltetrahydrofolate cyclo-ligase
LNEASSPDPGTAQWPEIRDWRKRTRNELIERRLTMDKEVRRTQAREAIQNLYNSVDLSAYSTIGIYWPIRGEIDTHAIAHRHIERGGRVGLPVVVEKASPVQFWNWYPGIEMKRGFWDIPIPAIEEVVTPELLIIPLIGFDRHCYRLGYGGGYYDRTLAAASPRPFTVGIGFAAMELPTIYPQPHDIGLDMIVTNEGTIKKHKDIRGTSACM